MPDQLWRSEVINSLLALSINLTGAILFFQTQKCFLKDLRGFHPLWRLAAKIMNLRVKVGKGINENFRKITSETDKRPMRMQTLMCHYFGGANMASKHRATCSVNLPAIFERERRSTLSSEEASWMRGETSSRNSTKSSWLVCQHLDIPWSGWLRIFTGKNIQGIRDQRVHHYLYLFNHPNLLYPYP